MSTYSLIISLVVFFLLTTVSILVVSTIYKQTLKLIKCGAEDDNLIKEYQKVKTKKQKISKVLDLILTLVFSILLFISFAFSMILVSLEKSYFDNLPTLQVVKSSSMATKNSYNTYLFRNKIDNQIQAFDLIITTKAPKEEDLKKYDIVVYEIDGQLVIHRIIEIEEPNSKHPNERWFLLRGDANGYNDEFPVKYEQIKGIYSNKRIPFIGSFILFMQSPAGWFCIALVIVAMIFTPILKKGVDRETQQRLIALSVVANNSTAIVANTENTTEQTLTANDSESEPIIQETVSELTTTQEILNETQYEELAITENNGLKINKNKTPTFLEKLQSSKQEVKLRYNSILNFLLKIKGVRIILGKKRQTFKKGGVCIATLSIRGKTLCVNLNLNPNDYTNTKYIYKDVSSVAIYKNYPMRLKLTSDRQTRWAIELLNDLANKYGLTILLKPATNVIYEKPLGYDNSFDFKNSKKYKTRTFKQRLRKIKKESVLRLKTVVNYLKSISGVRELTAKHSLSYKLKSKHIAKIFIKGKTVCLALAISPAVLAGTKYVYKDISSIKKHKNYQTLVKLTSDRQVKWSIEIINKILSGGAYEN